MDNTTILVPVVLRQHYAKHREDYYATVCLLADIKGRVLAAGVGFQSETDQHTRAVGRNVAIGRAVKALSDGVPNSYGTPSGHVQRVNRELGCELFNHYKGLPDPSIRLPEPIQSMIDEAVNHRMRLLVNLDAQKWKFVEETLSDK